MGLHIYRANVDAMVRHLMERIVRIVSVNTEHVLPNQPHPFEIAIMGVDVQLKASALGFYVIFVTHWTKNARAIVNRSFLAPNVREYVMRILHMIIITVFVIQCVHRVGRVAPVMGMGLATMDTVSAMIIGLTMGATSV
jgi:hypothetical protein